MFFKKKKKSFYLNVLDIGTSKICCAIVHFNPEEKAEIVGCGYARSQGIKNGMIVHLDKATECISKALKQAEQEADNRSIEQVIVNVNSASIQSVYFEGEMIFPIEREVSFFDAQQLIEETISKNMEMGKEILHAFPLKYSLNDEIVENPVGLIGQKLKVQIHAITIPESQLRNLVMVLDRCHVTIREKVASPYATSLAVLTEEEKEIGASCIDFGAGGIQIGQFIKGMPVRFKVIAVGGNALTRIIAQELNTTLPEAERLKINNASAFSLGKSDTESISFKSINGEENQISSRQFNQVILPKIKELLEAVETETLEEKLFSSSSMRWVMTGGGSHFEGISELVMQQFPKIVRVSHIKPIVGLPKQMDIKTFSTCIGLIKYVIMQKKEQENGDLIKSYSKPSKFKKGIQWIIQNF